MSDLNSRLSPLSFMLGALLLALLVTTTAVLLALRAPQLDLPQGAQPVQVGAVTLIPTDLYPEPDHFGTYPKMEAFFDRQSLIMKELRKPSIAVTYADAEGAMQTEVLSPRARMLSDLPFAFWFQQAVGILALLTGGWVLALRREDWGARMFGFTALFVPIFAQAASVYSTRQIAMDGEFLKLMSQINHFGAAAFGTALVGLFLMYPRPMVHPKWLLVPLAIYGTGIVLDLGYVGEDLWMNLIVPSQMLLAIIFGTVQWWRAREDPLDRAGLRWFLLFSLIGCSLFVGLSVMPVALGLSDQGYVPQAFAFGFFNLMHIGLAFGVTRWRVFELDRYAYYVWLWLGGAALIFAADLVLLLWLREQPWASLSLALIIGGFLYFPLRQLLMGRLFHRKLPQLADMMPSVLDTALAPTAQLQALRWTQLLRDTFAPAAEPEVATCAIDKVEIRENGVALAVPGPGGAPAYVLRYAAQGRRLFSSEDAKLATAALNMHRVVDQSHLAYERGVNVERDRISRDVHDNIGAQLLSALHAAEGSRKDALLRDALTDLRQIISDGFRSDFRLTDIFADLRAEMGDRLEAHGIAFDWNEAEFINWDQRRVPFLLVNTLRSVLREATSNIIKHAGAGRVCVTLTQSGDMLEIKITDNGVGFDASAVVRGEGLNNMTERATSQGGTVSFSREGGLTGVHLRVPLERSGAREMVQAAQ